MGAAADAAPPSRLRRALAVKIRARWLLVIVPAVYVLFATAVWFGADSLLFVPHDAGYTDGPEIIKIAVGRERISAVHHRGTGAAYTILFAHGNAVDLGDLDERLAFLTAAGYDVVASDYRGYGTSDGSQSEGAAYADIDAAYRYLVDAGVDPEHLIVMGHSMGSGPALHLATERPVGGLVLESPFTSAFRVAVPVRLLPFDRFDNLARIGKLRPGRHRQRHEGRRHPAPHGPPAVPRRAGSEAVPLGRRRRPRRRLHPRRPPLQGDAPRPRCPHGGPLTEPVALGPYSAVDGGRQGE